MLEFLYFSMKIWRSSNKLIRSQISGCLVCGRKCDMAQIKTKSSVLEFGNSQGSFLSNETLHNFCGGDKKFWPVLSLQHSSSYIWAFCFDYTLKLDAVNIQLQSDCCCWIVHFAQPYLWLLNIFRSKRVGTDLDYLCGCRFYGVLQVFTVFKLLRTWFTVILSLKI